MWIKTDDGELMNLDYYHRITIVSNNEVGRVPMPKQWGLDAIDNKAVSYIAFCDTKEEAERVRDNIFYCLKQGEAAVDVADLRDVDLEKQDAKDLDWRLDMIAEGRPKRCRWRKLRMQMRDTKGADKCVACLYVLGSPACIREKSKCTDTKERDNGANAERGS